MKKVQLLGKSWPFLPFLLTSAIGFTQTTEEWVVRETGTGTFDGTRSLTLDGGGNVYVTGSMAGVTSGNDFGTIKYNPAGIKQWEAKYNGPGNGDDDAFSIVADRLGNIYVTGRSTGNGTAYDYATIKYNSAGVEQWAARYNGPGNGNDWAKSIEVDGLGNVYVTGESAGDGTASDYATIKYNRYGVMQWVARYDGPGNNDAAHVLDIDKYGNVYVTGRSPMGTDLDEEDQDYTTIKYSQTGKQVWLQRYDGPAAGNLYDEAFAIKVDASGNVYVTGSSAGSGAEDAQDYATVKYDTDGNLKWSTRYNGPVNSTDQALSLAVDSNHNVYVTGFSSSEPDGANYDYATIKYNAIGGEVWVRRVYGPANPVAQATSIALDIHANVYVTGRMMGEGTLYNFSTIKYSTAGNGQWSKKYNGPANGNDGTGIFIGFHTSHPIAVDLSGNVYVTGVSTGLGTGFDYTTIKYSQAPPSGNNTGEINQTGSNNIDLSNNLRVWVTPIPVAGSSKILYELPVDGRVSIQLFDVLGRELQTVVDARKPAGIHNAELNLSSLQRGMYYYRITVKSAKQAWLKTGMIMH